MYFEGKTNIVVQVLDQPDALIVVAGATEYVNAYWPVGAAPEVRAVTVHNSYVVLTGIERRVEADRASIVAQGGELMSVYVDLQRNQVVAAFIDTSREVQIRIVSAYAEPNVIVAATASGPRRKL